MGGILLSSKLTQDPIILSSGNVWGLLKYWYLLFKEFFCKGSEGGGRRKERGWRKGSIWKAIQGERFEQKSKSDGPTFRCVVFILENILRHSELTFNNWEILHKNVDFPFLWKNIMIWKPLSPHSCMTTMGCSPWAGARAPRFTSPCPSTVSPAQSLPTGCLWLITEALSPSGRFSVPTSLKGRTTKSKQGRAMFQEKWE